MIAAYRYFNAELGMWQYVDCHQASSVKDYEVKAVFSNVDAYGLPIIQGNRYALMIPEIGTNAAYGDVYECIVHDEHVADIPALVPVDGDFSDTIVVHVDELTKNFALVLESDTKTVPLRVVSDMASALITACVDLIKDDHYDAAEYMMSEFLAAEPQRRKYIEAQLSDGSASARSFIDEISSLRYALNQAKLAIKNSKCREEYLKDELMRESRTIIELEHTRMRMFNDEEVWIYDPKGENIISSLVCPLTMHTSTLQDITNIAVDRALAAKTPEEVEKLRNEIETGAFYDNHS